MKFLFSKEDLNSLNWIDLYYLFLAVNKLVVGGMNQTLYIALDSG